MTDCGRCPDRATRKGEINPHNSFYDVLIILKDRQHNFQQSSFFFQIHLNKLEKWRDNQLYHGVGMGVLTLLASN